MTIAATNSGIPTLCDNILAKWFEQTVGSHLHLPWSEISMAYCYNLRFDVLKQHPDHRVMHRMIKLDLCDCHSVRVMKMTVEVPWLFQML